MCAVERACFPCRRLPLPSACFPAPIPPPALAERSSLAGRGRFIVILCKGLRPLHPRGGLNPRGTGVGANYVFGGRRAFLVAGFHCLPLAFLPPIPPTPFPGGEGGIFSLFCRGLRPRHPGLNLRGAGSSCGGDCLRCCLLWNRHKRRPNNRFIREKFWGVWGTLSRVPQRFPRRIRRDFFLKTSCFFSADGV